MKFYTDKGEEISLNEFTGNSIVIARVTKPMFKEEFVALVKNNDYLSDRFKDYKITLIWCPDWIEFKEWK